MQDNPTFISWLFSKHEIVEKTVGLLVLTAEVLTMLQDFYQVDRAHLTRILNLLFLVFIYFYLKTDFLKRFSVNADSREVARILRLSHDPHRKNKISALVFQANTFISQLQNVNYFIAVTAGLYVLLLAQPTLVNNSEGSKKLFHLLVDLLSYAGAFFLLRCYFVMYLPTIDKNGNDILNKKTSIYLLAGAALIFFDVCTMATPSGRFVSEFVCGVVNSVVFCLLIARFGNKILDIPPVVLGILVLYAIVQTCLPFVTGGPGAESGIVLTAASGQSANVVLPPEFGSIVLTICLIGKITLSAVLLYVLNTKRVFYYFMTLRLIHEEEDKNWSKFFPLIEDFSVAPENFSITYNRNTDSTYTALMVAVFDDIEGTGATPEEAKRQLLNKLKREESHDPGE